MLEKTPEIKVNIRPAVLKDVPIILKLIKELSVFEKMSEEVTATEESLKLSLFGDKPYAQVLLAEVKGEPIGYALYFFNFSTFLGKPGLYLEDIYVKEEYRGKGIGTTLFKYCASIARKNNCSRMEWLVLNWNPARDFYEHIGAKPLEEWVVYRLTGDALDKMAKL
ncbi:MAG: GNAT family N-acetyltransferase [Candidatus Caldatribacteriota bacterium]